MKPSRSLAIFLGLAAAVVTTVAVWPGRSPLAETSSSSPRMKSLRQAADSAPTETAPAESSAPVIADSQARPADFGAWVSEPLKQPDFAKIEAFDSWVKRWKDASPEERAAMTEEGARLAGERREEFKALIASDPRAALAQAIPRVIRQDLPKEILASLEKPVSATGDLDVYKGRPAPGTTVPERDLTLRYFEADGMSYKARVYGEMEPVMSRKQVPLRGVAMDRELAVAESPVRQLEVGERIAPGTVVEETCPVSGKTTEAVATNEPVKEETPTIEVGERVITLCNGSHVTVMDEKYRTFVQASGPGGPGFFMDAFPGTSSRAIGNFRCLYIRATYPDQMAPPNTEDQANADMRNTTRFFLESSYGKMTTTSTVTPLITLPQTLSWYIAKDAEVNGLGVLQTQARAEARKLGYDPSNYDCIILRVNGGLRSGSSWGGGDSVWLGWGGMDVINHECGHSLGLGHANYWATTDGTPYGNGENQEYGNGFDVMGGGGGYPAHYNTTAKRNLGWLPNSYVHFPKTNGVYRIYAFDQPQLEEGKRYGLNVAKDSTIQYNLEYHANNPTLANQALVLYGSRLIDTTQGSAGGKGDGGIQIGRTYSDPEADIHFTVVGKNATSPASLDVAYFRGPFPGNTAPVVSLAADSTTISAGGSVTFTATATDANGDTLAYQWEFDDGVTAANSNVVTRSFPNVAQVTAMVTVSDMRGGTTRRHVVINVGAHGKQIVSGNISAGGTPLANVRVSTGSKYAYTDADGNYSLSGISTGSQTLAATLNGYTLTPSFTNPLAVVAGTNTANWTAAGSVFVSLVKTADATEGGTNGSYTITRTGDTTADLVVRVAPVGGTATKTTDYTFTPDYATDGSYRTFTIPAGQASLVVSVAAVNDTAQEGPESISLSLASNGTYLSNSPNATVMTVVDNDTTLPQVAVASFDAYAMEPADAGSFTFTRTGSTAAALNLAVTWTGAATNGTDYTTLPTTVTIPSGQSSVTLSVAPINDSDIEVPEDIIATISTNAAYVRDTAGTTSTVTLSDDDTPYVTVSVPDADASEAGPDSGMFLLTRTGSTAAPLKVYYGLSGSAFHGTDYAPLTGEVIIPAGATSAPVIILPYDDDLGEAAETVTLAVATFNNAYSVGEDFQASLTIADNADIPVVAVRAGAVGVEGGANATLVFRSIGSGTGNVTVNYTVGGTATAGTDYTALSGSVVLPANGTNDVTVTIPVTNDTTLEPTETVAVKITPGASYRVYNDGAAEAAIRDNDSGDRVMVSAYNSSPTEAGAIGQFYISRAATAGDLTVNYTLTGTATSGTDYTGLTGSVVIPDTQSGVVVAFTPVDDAIAEGTETVTLNVVAGTGYGVDRPASATLEIADSETPAISVGFQAAAVTMTEQPGVNGEYRDIAVNLSAASAVPVTVEYVSGGGTASGDDVDWSYVDAANGNVAIPKGTLTFAPGVTTQNLRIRIKNDGVAEGSETAVLLLRAPYNAGLTAGKGQQSITIFDDVAGNLVTEERWNGGTVYTNNTWNSVLPDYTGFLNGFTTGQNVADSYSRRLTGQIIAPATGTYNFWIASDDASRLYLSTDATAANKVQIATVSGYTGFQAWDAQTSQKSANINLVAGQSYYMEVQHQEGGGGDHASVAWQGPGLARTPITFTTPDTAPRFVRMLAASGTRVEGDGSEPKLQVVLDRPAGATAVTVNYSASGTATNGSDYSLTAGALTFATGEQMKPIPLSILTDAIGESPESIVISLSSPSGAALTTPSDFTLTLLDANAPAVVDQQFTATSGMTSGTVLGTVSATVASGRSVASWSIVAGNGSSVFGINASGQVSLLLPASLPNPGTRQLVVRVTDNLGSTADGTVNVICNPPAVAGVSEQRFAGATPYNTQTWTGTPNYSGSLATFTTPQDVAENYSRRLTGYIQPSVSGVYTFWIASDDASRLFLSTNETAANKVEIATVSGYTGFQSWDSQSSQKSTTINLIAGQVYYLEVHHNEGGGGDHASVAWSGPGFERQAIPASSIFPVFGAPPSLPTIAVTAPTGGASFTNGSSVTLTAAVVGGSLPVTSVEFYQDGALIGSDNVAPFSTSWTASGTLGSHSLTAKVIYSGGSITSSTRAVTISNSAPSFTANPIGGSGATEDSAYSGSIASYGADIDPGDSRSYSKVSGPSWLSVASNGALSGTPLNANVGANGFTVRVTDAGGLTADTTLNISVANTNDAPNFTANPITGGAATEDSAYSGSIASYGADIDTGDTRTYSKVSGPSWLSVASNGSLSGTPLNANVGANGFTVRVTDAGGLTADTTLNISVTNTNDAPNFTANPITGGAGTEDSAYSGSIASYGADIDVGDTRTYSKVSGPSWLSVASNGALSGTPLNANVGANGFTVRVTDAGGLTADTALNISVANTNDAPTFTANPITGGNATEDAAYTGSIASYGADIDTGDTRTYSKVSGPSWLSVASNGALSGTPLNADVGANSFTVRVTDAGGLAADTALNVSVDNINDAPVFASALTGADATAGAVYSGTISGSVSDVDTGDTHSYSKVSGPAWLVVASDGSLSGTPGLSDAGANSFTVRATDAGSLQADTTLAITVIVPDLTADPDGDGYPNGLELNAGSSPFDAGSIPSGIYAGLKAWYKLDETSGTTADDTTGRPQDGTIAGTPASVTGIVGNALNLDAIDDGIVVGTSAALTGATDFTVMAWVKVAPGSPSGTIIQQRDPAGYNGEYQLNVLSNGAVQFMIYNGGNQFDFSTPTTHGLVNDNQWHLVAATRVGTTGTIYVDGNPLATASGTVKNLVATLGISIGYDYRDNNKRFKGLLDDVRIYTRALTGSELNGLHDGFIANRAPVFAATPFSKPNAVVGSTYSGSLVANGTDPDVDVLTFSKTSGPSWLTVASNGALSGTPAAGDTGANSFTVSVADPDGLNASATMNLTVLGALPAGWAAADIGSTGAAGSSGQTSGTYTITASGVDIWGTADTFRYTSTSLTGDGEIRARVTSQQNTGGWAKAGVMIRDGAAAGAAHAMMVITPSNGYAYQYRATSGGSSSHVAGPGLNTAPNNWVRLTRSGNLITSYVSANGSTWTQVGQASITMGSTVSVGLAANSNVTGTLNVSTFDNVTVTPYPSPWLTGDFGSTGVAGRSEFYNNVHSVIGAGVVGGTADGMRYTYQSLTGDGEITARIPTFSNTGTSARVGVMIRDTLTADSGHVFVGTNASGAFNWSYRTAASGATTSANSGTATAPNVWVRLVRSGTTFTAYTSVNGTTWATAGTVTATFATNCYIGFATSSGNTTGLNTATFDSISVTP